MTKELQDPLQASIRVWSGLKSFDSASDQALADVRPVIEVFNSLPIDSSSQATPADYAEAMQATKYRARSPSKIADHSSSDRDTPQSLVEAARQISSRETTAVALTEACLTAIDRLNPKLNCFTHIDREAALEAAQEADQLLEKGGPLRALHGVPLAHKDMFYRAGRKSTLGAKGGFAKEAPTTATVLQRLDAAGAIDLGALNMAEYAQNATGHNLHHGHIRNPWNLDYCPGGSSSGSGASVAARLVYAAMGSDTGSSIRTPASMCGVTGLKPTLGRVSRHGVMPLSFSVDVVGPIARTARDCARLLSIIAGHDDQDPYSSREEVVDYERELSGDIRGLRIAVLESELELSAPDIRRSFEDAIRVLSGRGAVIGRVSPKSIQESLAYASIVSRAEAVALHSRQLRDFPEDYSSHVRARLYAGFSIPAYLYVEAMSRRAELLKSFVNEALSEFDLVASPTLRQGVPTLAETDSDASDGRFWKASTTTGGSLRVMNYLGLPAISVPTGLDGRGLPIGMQIAGRPFSEEVILRAADAYQRDTRWHMQAPSLVA